MAAKSLLPLYGGGAFVWTTCIMFFQAALLLGYLYSQWSLERMPHSYARVHAALILAAGLLPALSPPDPGSRPLVSLLGALALGIGPVFLALSTASPTLQRWAALSGEKDLSDPYFLFGVSNAGALAALLFYPFVWEPFCALSQQQSQWRFLYIAFAALVWACLPPRRRAAPKPEAAAGALPGVRETVSWIALSAGSSAAMLAASNWFAFNLASLPMVWIIPLGIYLATFILAFKRRPWRPEWATRLVLAVLAATLLPPALLLLPGSLPAERALSKIVYLESFLLNMGALAVIGLICHGSLSRGRPAPGPGMPRFYTAIAFGGWLGTTLIAVDLPLLGRRIPFIGLDWLAACAVALSGMILRDWGELRRDGAWRLVPTATCFTPAAALLGLSLLNWRNAETIHSLRNFYGIYRVEQDKDLRVFIHGNTLHGAQGQGERIRRMPLSYYHPHSPFGDLWREFGGGFREIGVVGLGVGAIAAYGRVGQSINYYELDPDVGAIAQEWFTYLEDSPARAQAVYGDARLSLSRARDVYDLLVLDAFTSDVVPVHLLTREAFEVYLKRLRPEGIIVCHISSRLVDLRPVLAAAAESLGIYAATFSSEPDGVVKGQELPSRWVALTRDRRSAARLLRMGWADLRAPTVRRARLWTDQHASLLSVLVL